MNKKLVAIFLGTSLALAACSSDDGNSKSSGSKSGSNASAEDIVNNSCISCHGGDLKGVSGPDISNVGSKYSAEEIEKIINKGRGGMPAGLIPTDEATVVAKWLSEKK